MILIQMFVLKVINNERKILTHHEIIDRIAEQIVLVITQVKLWIHSNLWRPSLSFKFFIHLNLLTVVLKIHGP